MTAYRSPSSAARIALLSSVSLMVLMVPALGATIIVNAPDANGVQLDATDNELINNSTITIGDGNGPAVYSNDPVVSILNNAGATITGSNTNSPVFIDNTIGTFTNHGTITGSSNEAVGANGLITTFVNTGTITSTDQNGVNAQGGFGSFANNGGTITGDDNGVTTGANATTFTNSGSITGLNDNGVGFFNGSGVGTFANSGTITGAQTGVSTDGGATSFTNSGTIIGQADNGVGFYNNSGVGTFYNTKTGIITGFQNGVTTDNGATLFTNEGTITGQNGSGVGFFNGAGAGTVINSGTIRGLDGNGIDVDGNITSLSNLAGGVISGDNGGNDAAGINFNGTVGTFSNAGSITGEGNAVNFNGNVTSFTNAVGGTLNGGAFNAVRFAQDVNSFSNAGNIFAQAGQAAVGVDGVAGTIFNAGVLSGGDAGFNLNQGATSFTNSSSGNISGTNSALESNDGIGTFQNSGTMSSTNGHAVRIGGNVTSFTNAGTISSANAQAVNIDGLVTSFVNSGTISAANARGIYFDSNVGTFTNSGTITSLDNGVTFDNDVTSLINTGTILSTAAINQFGIRIDGAGTVTNSGLIQGADGIVFDNATAATVINSGTIRGTNGNAIYFNNGDGLLKILTGSQIFGNVDFAGGADTFDFSNFYGTTVLYVPGLETVVAGDRAYAFIAADTIAIFDPTGATGLDNVQASTVGAIRNVVDQQLANIGGGDALDSDLLINGYVAERPQTEAEAATAVMSDLSVDQSGGGMTVWASAFGGGAQDNAPVDLTSTYGGLVVGTHAALDADHTLGGLAAYSRSSFDVANGQQTITSDTGILGVYGKSDLGVVTVDYSLLGGVSSHSSSRQVVALGVLQTATASFSSWFLSPEIGVELPLLATEEGELNVRASASYVGGAVSSYTETAPGGTVTVGAVGIGVWQGELELNGTRVLSSNEHGDVELHGKVGVFAQANAGNSNIPINMLGTTISYTDPGTTAYGAFAGVSISAPLTDVVSLNAGVNGSVRSDGTAEGSANLGIAGDF